MEITLRPVVTKGLALTAAGAVAVASAPPAPEATQIAAPRASVQMVHLTDAWSSPSRTRSPIW